MIATFRTIQPKLLIVSTANHIFGQNNTLSTKISSIGKVDFNFIKKTSRDPDKLLIDVRSQREIKETGQIPGSINIELDTVCQKLGPSTSESDFCSLFGRPKPSICTQLIFTCRSGKRALQSAVQATSLGYKNVWIYEGSWNDWEKKVKENENCK